MGHQRWGKIGKLKTFDLNFFLGKYFFGDDDFRNTFVYQQTLDTLKLKEDKGVLNMLLVGNQNEYILLNLHY